MGDRLKVTKDNIKDSGEFCVNTLGTAQVNRLGNLDYRGPIYICTSP